MVIRLTLNAAVHAVAGIAVGSLAVVAAEGWRRALRNSDSASDTPADMTPPADPQGPAGDPTGAPDG